MFFSPRISQRELAQLCRRMAIGLESGIDVRRVWERESAGHASSALKRHAQEITDKVRRGTSVTDALTDTGQFFPVIFRELVEVGEQTGHQSEVFRHLAEHYEYQVKLRRIFRAAIAWPMLQLTAAVAIIGLLILVMGWLPEPSPGKRTDILGFGLIGTQGLVIYLLIVGAIVLGVWLLLRAMRSGIAWTRPIQYALVKLPGLGGPLQTLALSRLAWSLHLTTDTGMSLLRALPLSLRSMHNTYYTDHIDEIVRSVRGGNEISRAMGDTGVFQSDFLETLAVGEESGRVPETMALLSKQYQEQANRALATLTMLAGFAVWGLVIVILILLIFRVFSFYVNMINNAASGNF